MSVSPGRRQRRAFAATVSASAAPYGYTISIWSSGAMLVHFRGDPNVWQIFLFAGGAIAGYAILGAVAQAILKRARPLQSDPAKVEAGMFDWVAVGISVGAAALIAEIPSWVAWPLASGVVTLLYVAAVSVQLQLASRR